MNSGKVFKAVGAGGSTVVANPEMSGDENELQGLEVDGAKYKIPTPSGGKVYLHNFVFEYAGASTPVSLFTSKATPYTQKQLATMFNGHAMKLNVLNNIGNSSTSMTANITATDNDYMRVFSGTAGQQSWSLNAISAITNYNVIEMTE